jgi:hypothetical protein
MLQKFISVSEESAISVFRIVRFSAREVSQQVRLKHWKICNSVNCIASQKGIIFMVLVYLARLLVDLNFYLCIVEF